MQAPFPQGGPPVAPKKTNPVVVLGLAVGGLVVMCGLSAMLLGDGDTSANSDRTDEGEPKKKRRAREDEGPAETACQTGQVNPCACSDGASGAQACEDGVWGACQCEPKTGPACQPGWVSPCTCADGSEGAHACQDGQWEACTCDTPTSPPPPAPPPPAPAADVDAKGIPLIPRSVSAPPSVEEWASGLLVNTVHPASRPPGCTMRVVREWLSVNCSGNIQRVTDASGLGRENVDYFYQLVPGSYADFKIRLRPVVKQSLRIWRDNDRATLFVQWLPQKERPDNIALQICTPALSCWNL